MEIRAENAEERVERNKRAKERWTDSLKRKEDVEYRQRFRDGKKMSYGALNMPQGGISI